MASVSFKLGPQCRTRDPGADVGSRSNSVLFLYSAPPHEPAYLQSCSLRNSRLAGQGELLHLC